MFSSRNIHFAILGIILGAAVGYVVAFYQVEAAAPPEPEPAAAANSGMPANHPEVNDEAIMNALKKAAEESPDQPDVLARYANELFQVGRLDESAEWYRKVVALKPKDPDMRALYGAVLWRVGKKADAKTQLQTSLTQSPSHVPSLHGLFMIALDERDTAKANDLLKRIEKSEPDYAALPELKKRLERITTGK